MNEAYKQLLDKAAAWIEAHKAEYIAELQGIARIPSVSRADLAQPGAPFGAEVRRAIDLAMADGRRLLGNARDIDGYACDMEIGEGDEVIGILAHLDLMCRIMTAASAPSPWATRRTPLA